MIFLVLVLAIGGLAMEGVQMIMPNGSRVVVEAEDIAVDVTDATERALPEDEGELKNLLNWAISEHSLLTHSSSSSLTMHESMMGHKVDSASVTAGRCTDMYQAYRSAGYGAMSERSAYMSTEVLTL